MVDVVALNTALEILDQIGILEKECKDIDTRICVLQMAKAPIAERLMELRLRRVFGSQIDVPLKRAS